jgi:gas vesicle protein
MTFAFLNISAVLASVIVAAITGLAAGILSAPVRLSVETRLLKRKADTEFELARKKADVEYEFERRRELREQIGRYHGRLLAAVDAFSDRLENMTRHYLRGWLNAGGNENGPWSEIYYYRSTVTRFMLLMALIYELEHEAIFVDARYAEPTDKQFLIYAKAMRWVMPDVRLFEGTPYKAGTQIDHFFTDDLRRMCSELTACGARVDLDRLDAVLQGKHRLAPVMRYFDGLSPRTLKWDRLFALQVVLMAFMNDFGHTVQHSDQAAFASAAAQIDNVKVVSNLRTWLPKIGGNDLVAGIDVFRALDVRRVAIESKTSEPSPTTC